MLLHTGRTIKQSDGFSLAEMSIVMMIVGMIASSAISVAINSDYSSKRDQTENKLLQIDTALAAYLNINHRLPCPADGTISNSATNFGVESNNGASPPTCNVNFNNGNIWGGVVPVATLQLPNNYMFDGWGNRIDYIVDKQFTISEITNGTTCNTTGGATGTCFRDIAAGSITVKDGASPTHNTRTSSAVYVLLSHGPNGHGAFPQPGSTTTSRINGFNGNAYSNSTASADEFLNANYTNAAATPGTYTTTFVMRDFIRVDDGSASDGLSTTRTYFDDQLHFKTKSQIVQAAGSQIFDSVCNYATAITSGANTDCTGSTDCAALASAVNSVCLHY
jgi:hypothetical protein